MKIIKNIKDYEIWRSTVSGDVGFVPTMGALHEGHLSLIKLSQKNNKHTVVSIFVNALQFAPHEDFNDYPRTLDNDIKLLVNLKIDVLFVPKESEIYPKNFSFEISENLLSKKLEGISRPGFFTGVLTIVNKLFNIVKPRDSYFGQKDFQQLALIKKMVSDLHMPVKIHSCKTIRNFNGLALSSRNNYLNDKDKMDAAIIYKSLLEAKKLIIQEKNVGPARKLLEKNLKMSDMEIDYISVADLKNLEEIHNRCVLPLVISVAVWFKNVRLIDNIIVE